MKENTKSKGRKAKYDYESAEFLQSVYDLAFKGYNDKEIAVKLGLATNYFYDLKGELSVLSDTLNDARTCAREKLDEKPSVALFRDVCEQYSSDRYKIAKHFGVSWNRIKVWMCDNSEFQDAFDDANLKFLSSVNATGQLLAEGVPVKDKDGNFTGWQERPDSNMTRFYLQTVGKNYGYGDSVDVTTNGKDVSSTPFTIEIIDSRE